LAVASSASIPALFSPTKLFGMNLVDGGAWANLDLSSAINRCKEVVDDESDIIVDVILCQTNPITIPPFERNPFL
jgi:predicted acylesterase/phospholipase RssA